MRLLEELGLPELDNEQLKTPRSTTKDTVGKCLVSTIVWKKKERLNSSVEVSRPTPPRLLIDTDLVSSFQSQGFGVKDLAEEAVKRRMETAENCTGTLR